MRWLAWPASSLSEKRRHRVTREDLRSRSGVRERNIVRGSNVFKRGLRERLRRAGAVALQFLTRQLAGEREATAARVRAAVAQPVPDEAGERPAVDESCRAYNHSHVRDHRRRRKRRQFIN